MTKLEVGDHFLTMRKGMFPRDEPGCLEFKVETITELEPENGKRVFQVKIKEIQ